jgi:histidine ammonia-lyase
MSSSIALRKAGLKPISLAAKEGLALINGTHLMAGSGALLVHDARHLLHAATVGLAMSIDACRASHGFLDARLYAARKQVGPGEVAGVLRGLLAGSLIVKSHVANDPRVQDPYSLRAGPMVLGAVRDALAGVAGAISLELQAVTDNPLILGGVVRSGANFHGMPVAIPLDTLAIALCHIAGVSERRSFLMTGAFEPESHLKPFLAPQPGLQSGLMVAQYAAAACVNEMIGLATPASVANIPTCAGMEDYNSFGPRSAAKAGRGIELARRVVAIEMVIAAAGLDIHRPLLSGRGVEGAHKLVRRYARPMGADRSLTGEIEALAGAIGRGEFAEIGA